MIRFPRTFWLATLAALLFRFIGYGATQTGPVDPSSIVPPGSYPSQMPAGVETRYAVTHAHTVSQCVGYLYVSATRIRFEVVQPDMDKRHSFDLARSEIMWIQQWMLLGMPQNAVELRTARGNYHFWLLPENADLARTSARQWGIASAAPVATLLTGLQGQTSVPGSGVPASPIGLNSSSTYPGAYPGYPAAGANVPTTMPNVATTSAATPGSAYPSAYPSYVPPRPETAVPNAATPGPTYPGAYPAYPAAAAPATPMPNIVSPTVGIPYPESSPIYPPSTAGGASVPAPPMPNIATPTPPLHDSPYPGTFPPAYPSAPTVGTTSAMPIPNVIGPNSLAEYVYSAPQGWSTTNYPDGIVLNSPVFNTGERCLVTMWPMRRAGVDLIMDADLAFQTIYSTYELRDRSSDGMPVPQTIIRGTSGQGWDYVMLKKAIGKPSNPPGQWETLLGFVMVARLNGNLAVISGLSKLPLVSSCFGELTPSVWPRFFYSLRFRSWPGMDQTSAMAAKLAGVWTSATGNAADQYQFNANGRFGTAAAVQNYNRISTTEVLQTTQAFFGNGSYSLKENMVTLSPDAGRGLPETGWLRLEYESHDNGRSWAEVLYLLKRSAVDGKEYEVRYAKN